MFGNRHGQQISFSISCADVILFEVHRLNQDQKEQFFGWLNQHLVENNFNVISPSPEEQLRSWLEEARSIVRLLLEYQMILGKVEHFRRSNEDAKE